MMRKIRPAEKPRTSRVEQVGRPALLHVARHLGLAVAARAVAGGADDLEAVAPALEQRLGQRHRHRRQLVPVGADAGLDVAVSGLPLPLGARRVTPPSPPAASASPGRRANSGCAS